MSEFTKDFYPGMFSQVFEQMRFKRMSMHVHSLTLRLRFETRTLNRSIRELFGGDIAKNGSYFAMMICFSKVKFWVSWTKGEAWSPLFARIWRTIGDRIAK